MILETERLRLRPFREDDLDAYAALVGDPELVRHLGDGRPLSRDDAWRNLAMIVGHWQLRGYGLWAAEERATGRLLGRIGFFEPEGWPGFEIGWLVVRSHQGRGLATEGARVALDFAFLALGRERVISVIHPANAASIRVAEKLGERFERTTEVGRQPVAIYGIDRAAWQESRAASACAVPWLGHRAPQPEGASAAHEPPSPPGLDGPAPRLEVNGLDHLYLTVLDIERSVAFYDPVMRLLGFRKGTLAVGGDPHAHYFNRALQLSLRPARRAEAYFDSYAPGLHHVCLRLDGVCEVDAAFRELRRLGIPATEPALYPQYAPDYYATFFEDPDGIRLELVAMAARRQTVRARWSELVAFENPLARLAAKP